MKKPLSLNAFKNWLGSDEDMSNFFNISEDKQPEDDRVGKAARPQVGGKKLFEKIETEGNAKLLVNEFLADGGTVLQAQEDNLVIEVESGTFSIPAFCVKVSKV